MTDIAIIGGGASGIAAAIKAASAGAHVTLYERGARVGASILRSGNGRCNWSNTHVRADLYRCEGFVSRTFTSVPPARVWDFFAELGLLSVTEEDGKLYPRSNKATTVLDVLRFALDEAGVKCLCDTEVLSLQPSGSTLLVHTTTGDFFHERVIVACGPTAACRLLQSHPSIPFSPVLCPLITDTHAIRGLDNVRVKCEVTLVGTDGERHTERGEVLFRKYGVSGIVIFNLSRFARVGDLLLLDLLPELDDERTRQMLADRQERFAARPAADRLAGVFVSPLARALVAAENAEEDITRLAERIHALPLTVAGFMDKNAQVTRGGLAVESFDATTMASLRMPGVYATGEALDVDAPCGGFNLHWAWTSGLLAGASAAKSGESE